MSDPKDPAIKLFGKTIPCWAAASLNPSPFSSSPNNNADDSDGGDARDPDPTHDQDQDCCADSSLADDKDAEEKVAIEDNVGGRGIGSNQEDAAAAVPPVTSEDHSDLEATSVTNEKPKTPSVDKEAAPVRTSKLDEEQSETSTSQEKQPKKPDKILPCPRCNSMDTKFCYYNNYNVNQPRHFCKNCQRYWTAGGTMRNVPVGAGRRKNKNSSSHYSQVAVSETMKNSQANVSNRIHLPMKTKGATLTFGSDTPLCESMTSVLSLADNSVMNCVQNGLYKPEELRTPVSYGGGENNDKHATGSSVTTSNSKDETSKSSLQEPVMQNFQGFPPHIPCYPFTPWPYPWNSAQWSPLVPPAFGPPGYLMPVYPAATCWGCPVPGTWNVPWSSRSSFVNTAASSSSPNSPTLGKHSRDENTSKPGGSADEDVELAKENNTDRNLWIPKTLRIDDPGEAAKSSIWATLGIKNDKDEPITGGGIFKAFQSKGDKTSPTSESSPILQANPAAFSRSLNFHEAS